MTLRLSSWQVRLCLVLGLAGCDRTSDVPLEGSGGSGPHTGGSGSSAGLSGGAASGGGSLGGSTSVGGLLGEGGSPSPAGGSLSATGGGSPEGGMGGDEATGGGDGSSGGTGPATPDVCTFAIDAVLSAEIPTVGVVDWSTSLQELTAARIEFSLDDPEEGELNVGSGGPISPTAPTALLLGLKPERSYTYRIVVNAGATECVSPDHFLVTGWNQDASLFEQELGSSGAARSRGFVVTCSYSSKGTMIIDADGDVVWWVPGVTQCSRAHMDWAGEYMWIMQANAASAGFSENGSVKRVRMDGTDNEAITGLEVSHHDFAVLPGGVSAFLVGDRDSVKDVSFLVERSAEGTLRTVATLDNATLSVPYGSFHTNALRYYARDDSYSVSDLSQAAVFKLNRQGTLKWSATSLTGSHGHQLLSNGHLLSFAATTSGPSPVSEYSFTGAAGAMTAKVEWTHVSDLQSYILGDVQRLPNGNTLITYSTPGTIREVSPAGDIVQSLSSDARSLGYSTFRETLYGAPQ